MFHRNAAMTYCLKKNICVFGKDAYMAQSTSRCVVVYGYTFSKLQYGNHIKIAKLWHSAVIIPLQHT